MRKIILTALALLPFWGAPASAGEVEVRAEIDKQVSGLFQAGKFAELDRLADDYRINERRTPSGAWKLDKLHDAILSTVSRTCKDEAEFIAMEKRVLRWVKQNPDSATAHIVYAGVLRRFGWWYRGTGLARQVAPGAWEPFRNHIERARTYLMDRREQLSADPRWYGLMILIATDQSWERSDFYDLLREGLDRHPYYHAIYLTAVRYLSPKWSGNEKLLEDLANYAVLQTREEMGTGMYARIYWAASVWGYRNDLLTDSPKIWLKLRRSINDLLAQYPDQWNINHFARIACHAGQQEITAEMIGRIEGRPLPQVWARANPTFLQCRDWAQQG